MAGTPWNVWSSDRLTADRHLHSVIVIDKTPTTGTQPNKLEGSIISALHSLPSQFSKPLTFLRRNSKQQQKALGKVCLTLSNFWRLLWAKSCYLSAYSVVHIAYAYIKCQFPFSATLLWKHLYFLMTWGHFSIPGELHPLPPHPPSKAKSTDEIPAGYRSMPVFTKVSDPTYIQCWILPQHVLVTPNTSLGTWRYW